MSAFFYKKGMVRFGLDPGLRLRAGLEDPAFDFTFTEQFVDLAEQVEARKRKLEGEWMNEDESVLPENPPPPEVITYAERAAEDLGVSVEFVIVVVSATVLSAMTWAVRVTTQRGVVQGIPISNDVVGWGHALVRVGLLDPDGPGALHESAGPWTIEMLRAYYAKAAE